VGLLEDATWGGAIVHCSSVMYLLQEEKPGIAETFALSASIATTIGKGTESKLTCSDSRSNAAYIRQGELHDAIVRAKDSEAILGLASEVESVIAISTALHRLGKHGQKQDTCSDSRFRVLMEKFQVALPLFGARQLANALHGLGTLVYQGGGPALDLASIQTQRRIQDFEPQHVTNTIWACAKMRFKDVCMLQALVGRAVADRDRFGPVDFALTTWSCATLRYRDADWLQALVRVRPVFAEFSPQNMSNFVWAVAALGFRNDHMMLAVGREVVWKIQDFKPQELSNLCWGFATSGIVDNLALREVSNEVERRAGDLALWDPQSLANMMWAFATLAVKDDLLFRRLVDAATQRVSDFDCQELANSVWATAMVLFRDELWLDAVAGQVTRRIKDCQPMHLAQIAWAFSRFLRSSDKTGLIAAIASEASLRARDFAAQSLIDVYDALLFFETPPSGSVRSLVSDLACNIEDRMKEFCKLCAEGSPAAAQVASYRQFIEGCEIVTLGVHHTTQILQRCGLLREPGSFFADDARKLVASWRAEQVAVDPTGRSAFHRSQCVWRLRASSGTAQAAQSLADGIFASGVAVAEGERHGLVPCRLRHHRGGDAEFRALCAALGTSAMHGARSRSSVSPVLHLNLDLHISEVPCVSCLGAMLQFNCRCPGVLKVSFDRGREVLVDTTVTKPRWPSPAPKRGAKHPTGRAVYGGGCVLELGGESFDPSSGQKYAGTRTCHPSSPRNQRLCAST